MPILIVLVILTVAAAGVYMYRRLLRLIVFYGGDPAAKGVKAAVLLVTLVLIILSINIRNISALAVLHLFAVFAAFDLIALIVRHAVKRDKKSKEGYQACRKLYQCGILPILLAGFIFVYGFWNMGHLSKTEYTVETDKEVQNYKIALLTDIHYDTIQNPDVLKEKIQEINAEHPDIVVLGGDIVEEGTSGDKMAEVFAVLSGLESKYGIYYVYGNHDRQPYTANRTFTDEELEETVLKNNIHILEDDYVEINQDLILAGRGDAAWGNRSGRASSEQILEGVDRDRYIIMLDHQPIQAEENDTQGVDLELSGHTHAGQIWPVGYLMELFGQLTYGEYQRGGCKVIVSSGVAGWGYSLRTEEHCEYVIIQLKGGISEQEETVCYIRS